MNGSRSSARARRARSHVLPIDLSQGWRDAAAIATGSPVPAFLLDSYSGPDPAPLASWSPATFEDRRTYHPDPLLGWPARRFSGPLARLSVFPRGKVVSRGFPRVGVGFAPPVGRVVVCVRRKARRGVLHALGIAGGHGLRRPRRGPYSSVRC